MESRGPRVFFVAQIRSKVPGGGFVKFSGVCSLFRYVFLEVQDTNRIRGEDHQGYFIPISG